jgi:predicted RNA-binding protein
MRKVMGKYTIADPSGFKQKLKIMKKRERADKIAQFKRSNSKKSEFTEITGSDGISNSKISGMGTSDGASSKGG